MWLNHYEASSKHALPAAYFVLVSDFVYSSPPKDEGNMFPGNVS
jgi:hypothetical protein